MNREPGQLIEQLVAQYYDELLDIPEAKNADLTIPADLSELSPADLLPAASSLLRRGHEYFTRLLSRKLCSESSND
jgi:hypothetical protein